MNPATQIETIPTDFRAYVGNHTVTRYTKHKYETANKHDKIEG